MSGIEGGYATPVSTHEKSVLTDEEKVVSALNYNLEGDALAKWMAMKATGAPVESFVKWVADFNESTPEDRGLGKYDKSRTLDENVDIVVDLTTGSGYPLTVTLHKKGDVTLSTSLSQ